MTDLLLKKDESFRRLLIEKDEKYDITNVTGATKVLIEFDNPEALAQIWKQGLDNRNMRASDFNETSSRSHLMFAINIERTLKGKSEPCDIGKILYVDLAGSECLARVGIDGKLYKEGTYINESLQCLGRTIRQSSLNVQINFDFHILTQLMQDSLGGKSKTIMIANISPSVYNILQTRETLNYAISCGTITSRESDLLVKLAKEK